ncbi:hypothetical protein JVU11DRAFT_12514 [Chiua virens]|nr:hypothetical protein JVU11DRAFT_12514 [Chiua virens]
MDTDELLVIDELPLMDGLQDLPMNDDEYVGGVGNGMGLEPEHHRTLDELENDDDPLPSGFDSKEAALEVPALLINAFSDDDMSDNDDFADDV